MLPSSRKHLREAGPKGSRLSRACSAKVLERPVKKGDVVTYLVQIINEPDEVILLEVLYTSFIILPVKYVVETIGKLG